MWTVKFVSLSRLLILNRKVCFPEIEIFGADWFENLSAERMGKKRYRLFCKIVA